MHAWRTAILCSGDSDLSRGAGSSSFCTYFIGLESTFRSRIAEEKMSDRHASSRLTVEGETVRLPAHSGSLHLMSWCFEQMTFCARRQVLYFSQTPEVMAFSLNSPKNSLSFSMWANFASDEFLALTMSR